MDLAKQKYLALTTYRRDGQPVTTPVWVVGLPDGRLGFWTADGSGKVKRIRHSNRVTVQACNARGKPKRRSRPVEGFAEIVRTGPAFEEVHRRVSAKYGFMVPFSRRFGRVLGHLKKGQTYADTVVVIHLRSAVPGA